MNSASHPALVLYGSTQAEHHRFPLIMVVGREPNHSGPVEMTTGPYDFDGLTPEQRQAARRCAFWHMAYRVVGRMHDETDTARTASWLKDHCRMRGCSPIIIAGAIPQGQLNEVANKQIVRAQMSDRLERHAKGLFNLDPRVTERIGLVLLSGLQGTVFEPSARAIMEEAKARGIPCHGIPFFSPMNGRKFFWEDVLRSAKPHLKDHYLVSCLTGACIDVGRQIVSAFLEVDGTRPKSPFPAQPWARA